MASASERLGRFNRILLWGGLIVGSAASLALLLAFHQSTIPSVYADPSVVLRLQERMRDAEIAAAAGHPRVVKVNESELNSFIRAHLAATHPATNGNRLRDLSVRLAGNEIGVHVALEVYGSPITIEIVGTLRTVNDYARFGPVSARVGALPIPRSALSRAIEAMMAPPEERENMRLPRGVRDLRVEDSNLIATYQ